MTQKEEKKKFHDFKCWIMDVLSGGLEASPVAWKSPMKA